MCRPRQFAPQEILAIRTAHTTTRMGATALSRIYGCSKATMQQILSYRAYKDVRTK